MIEIKKLHPDAQLPTFGWDGCAGADLYAHHLKGPEWSRWVKPGQTAKVGSGIAIWIRDPHIAGLVFARSGKAINEGLALANGVALIDSDYQGELIIGLHNHSAKPIRVRFGDRIAQLALVPIILPRFAVVDEFSKTTARGQGGLGSTGR